MTTSQIISKIGKEKLKELKDQGLKIKVRHLRKYSLDIPYTKDIFVTKGEMKFDNNGRIKEFLENIANNLSFKIDNHGGITEISIFKDEKVVGYGMSECSKSDNFSRKRGFLKALTDAIRDMKNSNLEKTAEFVSPSVLK